MTGRDRVQDSYDRVPYPSVLQHHTHPDHLAVLALLHGLEPVPAAQCRVLELGCADGGNLIPMAIELPESRFTGVDLSPRQIEAGRAEVAALGLTNVDLRAQSILDVDESLGTFDYVICHGVFSWVEEAVQEQILAICRRHLAPQGIAYISYNTFPGWHQRRMLRDMVLYHTRGIDDPEQQTARAFELVRFLADAAANDNDVHAAVMRAARDHFEGYADYPQYMLHEYLEATNAPIYFHEMAARAASHGLQYVAEAEPAVAEVDNLSADVARKLRSFAGDRIELEQYLDFVLNRTFRRTLFTHKEIVIDRAMRAERMQRLFVSTATKPTEDGGFITERGRTFSSMHPVAHAVLTMLASAAPRAVPFGNLPADAVLADLLYSLYWSGVIDLHMMPPQCVNSVSAYPRATPLARRQAAAGLLVTNQRRRALKLDDPIARFLLLQLDGTRSHATLLQLLDREVATGRLDISVDGKPIREPHRIPAVLQAVLDHHLRRMAELALLVG
ncbi:MAG TPA: methyltransferase regulatory domain-containing protein [Thermoanaerobaculia bacterium]